MRGPRIVRKANRRTGKRDRTPSLVAWEIMQSSKMTVRELPDGVEILIEGPAAKIPALKNSKIPGTNFTKPEHLGRIYALDALYNVAIEEAKIRPQFGDEPLYMVAVIGARSNSFDPDNCFTTLKDWLEPATKPVGKNRRGWGIGLVSDDRFVSGFPVAARDLGSRNQNTFISIRLLDSVRDHVERLLREISSYDLVMTGKGGFSQC